MFRPPASCRLFLSKAITSIISLSLCATLAQAGEKDTVSTATRASESLDCPNAHLPEGFLKVYSATDEFRDADGWYFPHTSYAIYSTRGKFNKSIKNQRFPGDEIPETVPLPAGTYVVLARSEAEGNVRVRVIIQEAQQTVLNLDVWEKSVTVSLVQKRTGIALHGE